MTATGAVEFDFVFQNAHVFNGVKMLPRPISVGIRDGLIAGVSEQILRGRETVDARNHWLVPGLIESHIHLFDFGNATDPEKMAYYIDQELPGNLQSFLNHGFTTVKSVGDPVPELLATRTRLQAEELVGPRLLMTGVGISAPGGHPGMTVYGRNPWYRQRAAAEVDNEEDARAVVSRMVEHGVDAIKLLLQGGCRCCGEPVYTWHGMVPIVRMDARVFAAAIDEAHRHGLKATVHTYEQARVIQALEAGADGIEHGVVGERITDNRVIELLRQNDATYVPTLWVYPTPEALHNLAMVRDAGVRIALGSDSFVPTIKFEGIESGTFGANSIVEAERMTTAGLTPTEVLQAATRQAAVHLGRDDLGSIAEGKLADLVLLKGDPTVSVQNLKNPLLVIAKGRVVVNRIHGAQASVE